MKKVNISRIHNLMKQLEADLREKETQAIKLLPAGRCDFTFQIFEGTTDADIANFLAKVKSRKDKAGAIFQQWRKTVGYWSYLRQQLDNANKNSAVAAKLLELGCLQKEMANLNRIRRVITLSCSEDLDPVKGADYYKTSFTDKQKIYLLGVTVFSNEDLVKLDKEIEELEAKTIALQDEVALANQTTMVEIISFEEWLKQNA